MLPNCLLSCSVLPNKARRLNSEKLWPNQVGSWPKVISLLLAQALNSLILCVLCLRLEAYFSSPRTLWLATLREVWPLQVFRVLSVNHAPPMELPPEIYCHWLTLRARIYTVGMPWYLSVLNLLRLLFLV